MSEQESQQADASAIVNSPEFRAVLSRHNRFAWGWTGLVLLVYLLFDLVSVTRPEWLGATFEGHGALTTGILVAFGLCLVCVGIACYVALRKADG